MFELKALEHFSIARRGCGSIGLRQEKGCGAGAKARSSIKVYILVSLITKTSRMLLYMAVHIPLTQVMALSPSLRVIFILLADLLDSRACCLGLDTHALVFSILASTNTVG